VCPRAPWNTGSAVSCVFPRQRNRSQRRGRGWRALQKMHPLVGRLAVLSRFSGPREFHSCLTARADEAVPSWPDAVLMARTGRSWTWLGPPVAVLEHRRGHARCMTRLSHARVDNRPGCAGRGPGIAVTQDPEPPRSGRPGAPPVRTGRLVAGRRAGEHCPCGPARRPAPERLFLPLLRPREGAGAD